VIDVILFEEKLNNKQDWSVFRNYISNRYSSLLWTAAIPVKTYFT